MSPWAHTSLCAKQNYAKSHLSTSTCPEVRQGEMLLWWMVSGGVSSAEFTTDSVQSNSSVEGDCLHMSYGWIRGEWLKWSLFQQKFYKTSITSFGWLGFSCCCFNCKDNCLSALKKKPFSLRTEDQAEWEENATKHIQMLANTKPWHNLGFWGKGLAFLMLG